MEEGYNINQVFILEKMQSCFATSSPFQIRLEYYFSATA